MPSRVCKGDGRKRERRGHAGVDVPWPGHMEREGERVVQGRERERGVGHIHMHACHTWYDRLIFAKVEQ
jgi:hypothetical protein